MKLFDILFEKTIHAPTWEKQVGVEWVNVPFSITKEEQEQFKKANIEVPNWGVLVKDVHKVPVAYAYTLNMANNKGLMDAIKMRNPDHEMPMDNVERMIQDAIQAVVQTTPSSVDRLSKYKQQGLHLVQNMMKNGKKVIVTTMPSSSPLSKMIAEKLSSYIGATYFDAFEKHHFPNQSKWIRVGNEFKQRGGNKESPADIERRLRQSIATLTAQSEAIERKFDDPANTATDSDLEQFERLVDELDKAKQALANYKFEKKKQYDPQDRARGFYGYISPLETSKKLHKAYVILVDDNIISGETIAEAIKSLLRTGIVPTQMAGFAVHKYYSDKSELSSDDDNL